MEPPASRQPLDEAREIDRALDRALDLETDARDAFLAELAASAPERAAAVRRLLKAGQTTGALDETGGFFVRPLWDRLSREIARDGTIAPGTLVGPFRVLERIGEGGMAEVFRAERRTDEFRQVVALKVVKPGGSAAGERSRRFARERRIAAALDHPNIARLVDGGTTGDGRPYFAMELVDGRPIDRYCDEERLELEARLRLLIETSRAVAWAHRNLLVHRDLKPSNVFVTRTGHVKLLDFGIAKVLDDASPLADEATQTQMHLLTPEYASPEQISGAPITTASDLYQLGLILFELLTGRRLFGREGSSGERLSERLAAPEPRAPSRVFDTRAPTAVRSGPLTVAEIAERRGTTPAELRRRLRGDLDAIVLAALRPDPEDRYGSVDDFADDLERFLAGLPIRARGPGLRYRLGKYAARHRLAAGLGLVLAGSAVAAGIWGLSARREAAVREEVARRLSHQAEDVEQLLRLARLMPLHDTRRERAVALERVGAVEAEIARAGELARAAGEHALGRCWLALRDPGRARRHLENAWAAGLRDPSLRYALGQALGELYAEERRRAVALSDAGARRARLAELDRRVRDPALDHLRAAAGHVAASPTLVAGRIAFYERRLDEALEMARRATEEVPWEYESRFLEGEVLIALADELAGAARFADARAALDEAGVALGAALDVAESDPVLYETECRRWVETMVLEGRRGGRVESLAEPASAACAAAIAAEPDRAAAYVVAAEAQWRLGDGLLERSAREAALRRGVAYAEEAVRLDAGLPEATHRLGMVLRALARLRAGREDVRPLYARALPLLRRAAAGEPPLPFAVNGLALVLADLAASELDRGGDPRATAAEAIAQGERATALLPGWTQAISVLAWAHDVEARRRFQVGGDFRGPHRAALDVLEAARQAHPGEVVVLRSLGRSSILEAMLAAAVGEDASPAIARAIDVARAGLEIDARSGLSRGQLVLALLERAEAALARGRAGLEEVAADLAAAGGELATFPAGSAPAAGASAVRRELLAARLAILAGRSPATAFAAASQAAAALAAELPLDPEVPVLLAEIGRRRAAFELARGRPPAPFLEAGLAAVDRALALDPTHAQAGLERAALELLAAIARPPADLSAARRALDATVAASPNRAHEAQALSLLADRVAAGERQGVANELAAGVRIVGRW